ncbi:nitrogen regulation protein NR(II) [Kineobactrum salinum]|uniref:histidine kinase n=1 Tax=Kineobactrum salinum TaxID=2708301 RepID=A0A6C0U8F7_9GAMM|nr:nitrogen regulation protein NR(II) [Kineobactrum salinum]QIB65804.1 PAS domain-containing protein [Kineobactrum salinum]
MQHPPDILEHISTGVIALDQGLHVTAINSAAEVLLEASATRAMGAHAGQLVIRPREFLQTLEQARDARATLARRSLALTLHSGQEIQIDLIATPITSFEPDYCLLLELLPVDRLQRISREESMLHAQETTRAVIRGLAHEIKNPLGGVRGAAQLLAKELPNDELAEYTRIIIREADRLRDLVDRLLGPHQQLVLEDTNIHEIIEHVRNLISAEVSNQLQISRDYDPSLPSLPADRSQLVQAVLNIMRNALQAAEQPERCHILLRTRSQRQFTIGALRHRLVCRVDIIDNGPGIPADLQQSIFAPMVTGRANGSGLGLSIAQSIINRHGGLLECESEPGNTRFTLYLPMEPSHAETR